MPNRSWRKARIPGLWIVGLRILGLLLSGTAHPARRLGRMLLAAVLAAMLVASGASPGIASAPAPHAVSPPMSQPQHPCGSGVPLPAPASGKFAPPGCMSGLGCLLVIGIPVRSTMPSQPISWAVVHYWPHAAAPRGIVPQPMLGPPIRSA